MHASRDLTLREDSVGLPLSARHAAPITRRKDWTRFLPWRLTLLVLIGMAVGTPDRAALSEEPDEELAPTTVLNPSDFLLSDSSNLLPAPISTDPADDRRSLEERIRELEARLSKQQLQDELFANHLASMSSKKEEKPADPKVFKASWKNGLIFETPDKNFTAHIGGRSQIDAVALSASAAAIGTANGFGAQNAVDIRRGRFRIDGTIYKTIDYVMEYDFVNTVNDNVGLQPATSTNVIGVPVPTDLWWQFREIPIVGNVKVGLQKEPIGLEHLTSSRYLDFMERSYNQDAYTGPFNNGFTPGISILNNFGEDQRGLWHLGVFKNTDTSPTGIFSYAGSTNAGYNFDGRLSYLLWDDCEGRHLLHVAGSYSHRDPLNDAIRIRSRGSLRNGPGSLNPVYVDTGNFFASNQELVGAELSWIYGSFQVQSEYIFSSAADARSAFTGGTSYGTYNTDGYYVMASYFLTGEHREYEKKAGAFGRVVPHQNSKLFPQDCSEPRWGAWQVLARYSDLNLNCNNLKGGTTRDYTLGINWFLNPNLKIQANYVLTDRRDDNPAFVGAGGAGAGWINGFGMRMAHDF